MLSRRDLLAGASVVAAAGAFGAPLSFAKAPMQNTQAPGFYRFKVGAIEATVVSDGPLALGEPRDGVFTDLPKDRMVKRLNNNFLPTDGILVEQNALAINTGDRVVLFDTGMGSTKMFGDKTGRLLPNLKAAGIDPKDVDAVVLTHAHPDHCWGLMSDNGERVFANAQIYMAQADFDFWTDESKGTDDMMKSLVAGTRKNLLPNRERMVFIKDGQEILPGVQAMATPGHTPGHMSFMIASQGQSLFNIADVVHHHVFSMKSPRNAFVFDGDGKQAADTRVRVLDMLAAQRIPMVSYHFPYPGVGHVQKFKNGFGFVPSPMRMAL